MRALNFIRGNALIISLVAVIIASIFIRSLTGDQYTHEITLIRMVVLALLGYELIFRHDKNWNHDRFFKIITVICVLSISVVFLIATLLLPEKMAIVTSEDNVIEVASASLLFIAAALSLGLILKFLHVRNFILALIASIFMGTFFFLGMEEISWMQRVLNVESSGVFLEHNTQSETNLHNFNSRISNDVYYGGAFILLTVLAYYRNGVISLLKRYKLSNMTAYVPRRWLLIPFAVAAGFILPSSHVDIINIAILILTLLFISREAVDGLNNKRYIYATVCSVVLLIIIAAVAGSLFGDLARIGYINAFQEYREFVIAIGLAVYVADVYVGNFYKYAGARLKKSY